VVAVELDQPSGGGEAGEVLDEQATVMSTREGEFADELLVAGAVARGALDAAEKFAVGQGEGHRGNWR